MGAQIPDRSNGIVRSIIAATLIVALGSCNQREVTFSGNAMDVKAAIVINEMTLPAALIGEDRLDYQPAFGLVKETLTLKQKPRQTINLRQVSRPIKTELFTQGHPGSVTIRDYPISSSAEMDLLVVVDNSSSMAAVQAMLAEGMRDFIDNLQDIDWRIGVITSDNPSNPNLRDGDGCQLYGVDGRPGGQPILKSDPDASGKFLSTVINIGSRGSDFEESILNTYKHIKGTCAYGSNSWLRPNAMLGVLFVTDEDSFCPEPIDPVTGLPTRPKDSDSDLCTIGQRPADLADLLKPPYRESGSARIYSLTWRSEDRECYSNAQRPANRILDLVGSVGGFDNSICQNNYADTMRAIATDASRVVRRHFQLPHIPIVSSVVVTVDGVPTTDYRVEGSVLILNHVTPEQKVLHISYRHDPVPVFSAITLSERPDSRSLTVEVNGTALNDDDFTYNNSTGQIEFAEAPPSYAHVMVTYKVAAALSRVFDLGTFEADDERLVVKVNGVEISDFAVDPTSEKIEFQSPPEDGSEISITYRPRNSKVTNYNTYRHPTGASPLLVTVVDPVSKLPVDAKWNEAGIVFAAQDVVDGRQVEVTYNFGDTSTPLTYRLSSSPLDGVVDVSALSDEGDCVENLVLLDSLVSFNCRNTTLKSVNIHYKYVIEHYSSFTLNQAIPDHAFVQVFVDGVAVNDFTVEGQVVHVPVEKTKPTSVVKLLVLTRVY